MWSVQREEATVSGVSRPRRGTTWRIAAVVAASGALVISGCAKNTESASPATSTSAAPAAKVDSIASTVPESIKSSGKLIVGVNLPYAPNEFKDPSSGKIVGFDVDLMNAIAQTLGLTVDYREETDFSKIIPAIQGGTYNVGMSSFTDTKQREQQVDFVTYFSAGSLWAQRAGDNIDPNNACGKKVAVESTTVQDTEELPAKTKACTDAGKPPINVLKFDNQDQAASAVAVGQADAMSADSPVTLWAIKQSGGKLVQDGNVFNSSPYGWPVQKGSALAQSLLQALQHLIDNGTYKQIATTWGVQAGMIDKPVVNGATS
jgi:polar amino acid transport system substrate-binding protein